MALFKDKSRMVAQENALPGRAEPIEISGTHTVLSTAMQPPFADDSATCFFAMGCFWGAERRLWQQPKVISTAVGYMAGFTPNPTYDEVCSGSTGHTEAVLVVYENTAEVLTASKQDYEQALKAQGLAPITTEVLLAEDFYYAEEYHQQYLDKNPNGYCGLAGTGVACSI